MFVDLGTGELRGEGVQCVTRTIKDMKGSYRDEASTAEAGSGHDRLSRASLPSRRARTRKVDCFGEPHLLSPV